MKELSIEEKAQRYDEALKQIKECTPDENGFITIYPQEIFPELKESEDERIRKWLIALIKSNEYGSISNVGKMPCPKTRVLAWLEKQGNLMGTLQVANKEIGELVEENYYLKEKQGEQKLNTDFLDLRTWKYIVDYVVIKWCGIGQYLDNPYLTTIAEELQKKYYLEQRQGEQKPVFKMKTPEESLGIDSDTYNKIVDECVYGE